MRINHRSRLVIALILLLHPEAFHAHRLSALHELGDTE
jgi:hypothetical protein